MENTIEKAKKIRLAIFDVDGVLTTGDLLYGQNGNEFKVFNVHDGFGLKMLQKSGVQVGIITAKKSEIVTQRAKDLEIKHVYQGQENKIPAFEDLKKKLQLSDEEIAYVGDDFPDLPLIRRAGLGVTVASAPAIIQQYAAWITKAKGGKGAAREVCDLIMEAQGSYQTMVKPYIEDR